MGSQVVFPTLSKQQQELIVGCILGDGYIRRLQGRTNAFLEINHSYKAKDYVDWKYSILKNIVKSAPKSRIQSKGRQAYRFFTRQHPYITEIWQQFYNGKTKVVPKQFELTPLIVAIWFMDDGSCTKKGDLYLNTQQFDMLSQRRLLHALRLLGIKARLNKDGKYYRIRIKKESIDKFLQLIESYIHPSMMYKLEKCKRVKTLTP